MFKIERGNEGELNMDMNTSPPLLSSTSKQNEPGNILKLPVSNPIFST
jgi:hypothetical protein